MRKRWLNDTKEIKEQLKRRYRKQQVILSALTLNMRGVLNPTSSQYLKERRIIKERSSARWTSGLYHQVYNSQGLLRAGTVIKTASTWQDGDRVKDRHLNHWMILLCSSSCIMLLYIYIYIYIYQRVCPASPGPYILNYLDLISMVKKFALQRVFKWLLLKF